MSNLYFERYAYREKFIEAGPEPDLGLIITIPCFNETDLIRSLESLLLCEKPKASVEVIVVVNESEECETTIKTQNQQTVANALEWAASYSTQKLKFHIHFEKLPPKTAGVGLARKIAMDEAARRFNEIANDHGVIICFDADSICDTNYIVEIEKYFVLNPKSPGCSIYFEHPLEGDEDDDIYKAITDYELFLRYYVNALKFAQFPHAFQTIGSSMAVRAKAYQSQGGMNKRKAGEDFYFLHKIIPLGNFGEVNTTKVIPSPRVSNRVPFGTGKAVNDWLIKGSLNTYNLSIFEDLKIFHSNLYSSKVYDNVINFDQLVLPESILSFFGIIDFQNNLNRIVNNSGSEVTFFANFHRWFDGFKVLKFVHFARDNYYENRPIATMALALLEKNNMTGKAAARELLIQYRQLDRAN